MDASALLVTGACLAWAIDNNLSTPEQLLDHLMACWAVPITRPHRYRRDGPSCVDQNAGRQSSHPILPGNGHLGSSPTGKVSAKLLTNGATTSSPLLSIESARIVNPRDLKRR